MDYEYDQSIPLPPPPGADEQEQAVIVPPEQLQADTLRHLAVEFLLRETGNDISESGVSDERVERVLRALQRGTHLITFDPRTESVGIIEAKELQKTGRAVT